MLLTYWAGKHGAVPTEQHYRPDTYVSDDALEGHTFYRVETVDSYTRKPQGFGFMFLKPSEAHSSHMVEIMRYLDMICYDVVSITVVPS